MAKLTLQKNMLGFEIHQDDRPLTLYRATEELPRTDSPKPCFAPIYTPSGTLVTEYRPADHTWHTGLYFGWVHANEANLWGGPWYLPETKKYEYVENSHGVQRHDGASHRRPVRGDRLHKQQLVPGEVRVFDGCDDVADDVGQLYGAYVRGRIPGVSM